jgi:protein PhnA
MSQLLVKTDDDEGKIVHKRFQRKYSKDGDSVVLVKDLDVKGATFTANEALAVHNIKSVLGRCQPH